jgi:hypothetical protein
MEFKKGTFKGIHRRERKTVKTRKSVRGASRTVQPRELARVTLRSNRRQTAVRTLHKFCRVSLASRSQALWLLSSDTSVEMCHLRNG